jgi:ribosomal protein S18 acetylase RimI-like enzyme
MTIRAIENPTWSNGIKETLTPYSTSFEFEGVPDDNPLDRYEWFELVNEDGATQGVGWIEIDKFMGKVECEISLCVNSNHRTVRGIGVRLLEHLEDVATNKSADIFLAIVKMSNPEHDQVVSWFERRGYTIDPEESSNTNTCLKKHM